VCFLDIPEYWHESHRSWAEQLETDCLMKRWKQKHMRDAAAKAALQAIGRESLMGYTDEELVVYEDAYDSVIRALMNEEPFT
jgi:hypothetical protein